MSPDDNSLFISIVSMMARALSGSFKLIFDMYNLVWVLSAASAFFDVFPPVQATKEAHTATRTAIPRCLSLFIM